MKQIDMGGRWADVPDEANHLARTGLGVWTAFAGEPVSMMHKLRWDGELVTVVGKFSAPPPAWYEPGPWWTQLYEI